MSTLSTRTLTALAFERGEEFDPALTLPSAPLSEDLALIASSRALLCELSPVERRRRRERARRDASANARRAFAADDVAAAGQARRPRPM